MKKKRLLILLLVAATVIEGCSVAPVQIVPEPASLKVGLGYCAPDTEPQEFLDPELSGRLGAEGYILEVGRNSILIKAATPAGAFYARQTLSQLSSEKGYRCVKVEDKPRFSYRGFHLDVSRHFSSKEEVEKIIDEAARYKFNQFHFHLTDNGGWRIQIDSYPLLTQKGAYRVMKDWDGWWKMDRRLFCSADTPGAYGGFYTKDDIREIVAYAAERHINVIPEIEFPAHSDPVFVGYPELCCDKKPYLSGEFCPAEPLVYDFARSVLGEIMELFPSKIIHIGADEARKHSWKKCPACQALMKKEGMTSPDDLQCYMVSKIAAILNENGRTLAGWDEILKNEDLAPDTYVYSYRGEKGGIRAANRGLNAVMTPGEILYMDWYQASPEYEKKAMYGYSPIKKMYRFIPVPDTPLKAASNESLVEARKVSADSVEFILPENACNVAGIEGCAWREYIPTDEHLEYMMFPRLLAIAELAWTPAENLSWEKFRAKLPPLMDALRSRGFNVYDLHNAPEVVYDGKNVTMESENPLAVVRYTTDGTEPVPSSPVFEKPFPVHGTADIRAASFMGKDKVSYERRASFEEGVESLDYYPLTYYPS
ncbi:MAG: family 20 glycosylhydrolase [Bacteroidales bacterium]|nr:family 20 glycosylhydrolase [Bacteroidales bacterium]